MGFLDNLFNRGSCYEGDPAKWRREHPLTPKERFLAGERPYQRPSALCTAVRNAITARDTTDAYQQGYYTHEGTNYEYEPARVEVNPEITRWLALPQSVRDEIVQREIDEANKSEMREARIDEIERFLTAVDEHG